MVRRRVESELGKGSDFIVVIPREQEGDSQVIHNDVDIVDNSVDKSVFQHFSVFSSWITVKGYTPTLCSFYIL